MSEGLNSRHAFILDRMETFRNWLLKNGAELHHPHTEWEVIRFYTPNNAGCGVVYRNASGRLTPSGSAIESWNDYIGGKKWRFSPTTARLKGIVRNRLLETIILRDGPTCVVCGEIPENPSLEHLLDRSNGGTSHINNLAIACPLCNCQMEELKSLRQKIEYIIQKRRENATQDR
jgi:hypothetical protein